MPQYMRVALGLCLCVAVVGCYAQEGVEHIARHNEGDNVLGEFLSLQTSKRMQCPVSLHKHTRSIGE